jgi:signal transduction histidine kinase
MTDRKTRLKILVIAFMIASILAFHYLTLQDMKYHHSLYRMLFYVPLVLGSVWFGLKGAMLISSSVTVLYLPYVILRWQGFSFEEFDRLLEGVLYLVIAFILGFLVKKERENHHALRQAESLAAVGRAVSEIAHDMKTPLTAIGGFATQVARKTDSNDSNQRKLEIVIQETARLGTMVEQMLDFGKPLVLDLEEGNLNELVVESHKVLQTTSREADVKLESELAPSLPLLRLDANRTKQVILNLMANAVQACPAGEEVRVRTRQDNDWVVLEVIDSGEGIDQDQEDSVFDAFYSTRRGGTGLGLAIVRKIVVAHDGEVSFQANPDRGVTFTVRFPMPHSGNNPKS